MREARQVGQPRDPQAHALKRLQAVSTFMIFLNLTSATVTPNRFNFRATFIAIRLVAASVFFIAPRKPTLPALDEKTHLNFQPLFLTVIQQLFLDDVMCISKLCHGSKILPYLFRSTLWNSSRSPMSLYFRMLPSSLRFWARVSCTVFTRLTLSLMLPSALDAAADNLGSTAVVANLRDWFGTAIGVAMILPIGPTWQLPWGVGGHAAATVANSRRWLVANFAAIKPHADSKRQSLGSTAHATYGTTRVLARHDIGKCTVGAATAFAALIAGVTIAMAAAILQEGEDTR
eukprot:CAMPEP_0117538158 /NCGR_PEP_ID=MMETSP0784-20121206/42337_1 /TAXON_ID=39447 /ORGANISM="" /LENGTH=288 /DNA_ID=CAMNT_0005334769 /DNA_START=18 /DNA_END=882 /DNA_ORIENTATION=-